MHEFECPVCHESLEAEVTMAGQSAKCPSCQRTITIPKETQQPASKESMKKAQSKSPSAGTKVLGCALIVLGLCVVYFLLSIGGVVIGVSLIICGVGIVQPIKQVSEEPIKPIKYFKYCCPFCGQGHNCHEGLIGKCIKCCACKKTFWMTGSIQIKCQQCQFPMMQTEHVKCANIGLQALGIIVFIIGFCMLWTFSILTIIGILLIILGVTMCSSKSKNVWKCNRCGYFFERM